MNQYCNKRNTFAIEKIIMLRKTKHTSKIEYMAMDGDKFSKIIDELYNGLTLKDALLKYRVGTRSFYDFKASDAQYEQDYDRARIANTHGEADEIKTIADDPDIDPNRARNMIDARKWRASKMNPRVYGDRLDVNIEQRIGIGALILEQRNKALTHQQHLEIEVNSQVIETKEQSINGIVGSKPNDPQDKDASEVLESEIFK